jgi:hypothetical protein
MMFTRIAISTIALILATGIIFYFQYFIILISRPISSGISGVGFAVNIYLLLYSLPIAATLEAVLLAGLTYRGWIPRNLGIAAICVFFAIAAIVIRPLAKVSIASKLS